MVDFTAIRNMLMEDFSETSPTPDEMNAFMTALVWFEDALCDMDDTEQRLQELIPEKRYNYYLKKSLKEASCYTKVIEDLKKELSDKENELLSVSDELHRREKDVKNLLNLPGKTLNELRKENKYRLMQKEIEELKYYRDLFAGKYFGLLEKQKK